MPAPSESLDTTEISQGETPSSGLRTRLGRFYYQGKPVYLVQAGTFGLRTDRGYDGTSIDFWRGLVDRLQGLQTDAVRFRVRIDPWAFCYDPSALSPWQRRVDLWDLTAFDDRFWALLRSATEYGCERDVLFEFVFFNAGTLRMARGGFGWPNNPFNTSAGGMLTRDPAAVFFSLPELDRFDLRVSGSDGSAAATMQAAQERFVREAVQRLHDLDNVSWEIASQLEGIDPVRRGFVAHFVELLHLIDPLDRAATASVRTLRRADQELYRQAGIDTVEFWLASGLEPHEELVETVTALRQYAKPVVVGQTDIGGTYSTLARAAIWQTYVAGGHACAEDMLDDPALQVFVRFVAETGPGALMPDKKLVSSRTEGLHCHGARAEDGTIVLYVTAQSPASGVEASLRLAAGRWKCLSVLPATGEVLDEREMVASGRATQVPLPRFEEDMAVRLTKSE